VAKQTNGASSGPAKKSAPAPTATAAAAAAVNGHAEDGEKKGIGKPDQSKFNAEQEEWNKEIAAVKAKLVSLARPLVI